MTEAPQSPPVLRPESIRSIIFDLDGTLVDSYGAIEASVNHARAAFQLAPLSQDEVRALVGRGLECLLADVLGAENVEEGVRLFRSRYAEVFRQHTFALPEAKETLAALARDGFPLAVASNKPARFTRPILEHLQLSSSIRTVHGPDTVGSTKPEPTMLRRCMQDLGATPSTTLYVGDMLLDIESAAAAGVSVALVIGGSATETALRASDQVVLPALSGLCELLHENRGKNRAIRQ